MKLKKTLAVLCAGALMFALAVPTFAADATNGSIQNGTEIVFTGALADENKVSVSVLTALKKLYVNPYGLPYSIENGTVMIPNPDFDDTQPEDEDNPKMKPSGDTIQEGSTTSGWFSNTAAIRNESTTALDISVTMRTTEQGNVKVAASETTNPADNTLYGKFEIVTATYDTKTKLIKPGDWASAESLAIPAGSGTAGQPGTPTKQNVPNDFFLPGAVAGTDDLGKPTLAPAYVAFRLRGFAVFGSNSAAAAGGVDTWGEGDVANVSVAFSFSPTTPQPTP